MRPSSSWPAPAVAAPVTSLDEFVPSSGGSSTDQTAVYPSWPRRVVAHLREHLAVVGAQPTALWAAPDITSECSGALAATYASIDASRLFPPGWDQSPAVRADIADNEPGGIRRRPRCWSSRASRTR